MRIPESDGGLATGAGSVWKMTDANGTLTRIRGIRRGRGLGDEYGKERPDAGECANVWRIDPKRIIATLPE